MKTIRNHSRMLGSIILLVSLLAGTVLLAAPSAKELQSLASRAYERHNYKQAIEYANTLLKSEPKGDALRAAQRVKAMAMCMYKRTDGVTYAKKIMGEHAPFKIDAALWQAVGYDRQNRYDRKGAYEGYFKAATLYERAKKLNASATAGCRRRRCLPVTMASSRVKCSRPRSTLRFRTSWSIGPATGLIVRKSTSRLS
ncbi:MAG: hypothetical protein QGG25_13185 [Phycisphaerae bacterium]|jgi:hypothetical protein|nr:hypothetical protein [Phycisphaerae bacterium]